MRTNRVRGLRPLVVGLAFCVGVVGLGGCSTIRSTIEVTRDLQEAGYEEVNVNFTSDEVVEVTYRSSTLRDDVESVQEDSRDIAQTVWRGLDIRVDGVYVQDKRSTSSHYFTRAELIARFGPRDPALDDKTFEDEARRFGTFALIALAVGAVMFIGIVVLIVWLVVRSRRRKGGVGGPGAGGGFTGPGSGGFSGDPRFGTPGSPAGWTPPAPGAPEAPAPSASPSPGWQPPAPGSSSGGAASGSGWQPPPPRG